MKTKLRELVNKAFPERLKLEFGCEVKNKNITGCLPNRLVFHSREFDEVVTDNPAHIMDPLSIEVFNDEFEVLGKPTLWGDILRMLPHDEVAVELFDGELHIHIDGGNRIELDLTRSPEEQDSEVIEKLVGLLGNK